MAEEYVDCCETECRMQELEPSIDYIATEQKCSYVVKPSTDDADSRLHDSDRDCDTPNQPELGRDLCRVRREEGKYGGYKKDILTENLTERDKAVLVCYSCEGIMREPCVSSDGEQYCLCCGDLSSHKHTQNIPVKKIIDSLKCSCPLIERGCKWLGSLEDCENHLDTCCYVHEACELECGVVLIREELRIHEKEKCPHRIVKCEHCMKDFKSCELNGHLKKCPKMKVSCDLKCGEVMCREDMEQHLYHYCGMVQNTCNLGCGVELTRDELKLHEKDTCVQREIRCEHCLANVRFCDNPKHLTECPRVRVPCELCSLKRCREDMTEHTKHCLENTIECPFVKYKCMTCIKRKDMDKHLEENETKHLGLKLTAMEDLITKQSEKIDEQSEEITKLHEKLEKQNTQFQLLYSITDVTSLSWKIENVTDLIMGHGFSESERYKVLGYSFLFRMSYNREVRIVFPSTTFKHANPFRAKCHIALSVNNTINCGLIEVKQKDLTRGCERIITYISQEDVDKYSTAEFFDDGKKDLTLLMCVTML